MGQQQSRKREMWFGCLPAVRPRTDVTNGNGGSAARAVTSRDCALLLLHTVRALLPSSLADHDDCASPHLAARRGEHQLRLQHLWRRQRGVFCARPAGAAEAQISVRDTRCAPALAC